MITIYYPIVVRREFDENTLGISEAVKRCSEKWNAEDAELIKKTLLEQVWDIEEVDTIEDDISIYNENDDPLWE